MFNFYIVLQVSICPIFTLPKSLNNYLISYIYNIYI